MSTTSSTAERPPVRRIVTGHTSEGKAIIAEDGPVYPHPFKGSTTLFTDLYASEGFPSSNDGEFKDAVKEFADDILNPSGSLFRVVDMPPRTESVFHRTVSIDYGILISGSLTLVLDDNRRVLMKAGDVVVQRGTIHAWINETNEWTRTYFILLPTTKVKAGGSELQVEFKPLPEEWKASNA